MQAYGLKVATFATRMKALNSAIQLGYDMTLDVLIIVVHLNESHNLTVVIIDNLNLWLGIDFMRKFKAVQFLIWMI